MTYHPVIQRDDSRRVLGGVCAGFARAWGVDPLLVRAAAVVAAVVSSGLALVVYLVLWIALPRDRASRRRVPAWTPLGVVAILALLVLAAALVVPASRFATTGFALLGLLGVAWYAATRGRRPPSAGQPRQATQWRQPPMVPAPGAPIAGPSRPGMPLHGGWRPRPRTALAVLLATALTWAGLGAADAIGVRVAPVAFPASALALIGLGLVAAARPARAPFGRPRGLIPLGLVASLATLSLLLPSGTASAAAGYQAYSDPDRLPEALDLGSGRHTVDLSGLRLDRDRTVTITEDAGSLVVILPGGTGVAAGYQVDVGSLSTPATPRESGLDITRTERYAAAPGTPTLHVLVRVDLGTLQVQR